MPLDVRLRDADFHRAILKAIGATTGAGVAFVHKNIDKLRANFPVLVKDIKNAAGNIKRSVTKLIGTPENPFHPPKS